jgi:hypothetical protein
MGQTRPVTVHHLLLADDAEKNLDRYMAGLHGVKRASALEIHPGLYCDTAVGVDTVFDALDTSIADDPPSAPAGGAGAEDDPVDDLE